MPQMRAAMSGASVAGAAAQERLEQARRLEDGQPRTGDGAAVDVDLQRALALDAGEHGHADAGRVRQPWASASRRNGSAAALKVRKARWMSRPLAPSAVHRAASAAVLVVSAGPKQP